MLQKLVIFLIMAGLIFIGLNHDNPMVDLDKIEKELIATGVIDENQWSEDYQTDLNILWGFGLANKNRILEKGPMVDYDTASFASTGGWTLAKGDAMDHYSKHKFIILTEEQQQLVERTSKNIYRPCCGNSTYFPDCNHGMAMLGLLEILASQGAGEDEIYKIAKEYNARWFPNNYSCGI